MKYLTRDEWGAAPWRRRAPRLQPVPTRGWAVHHNGPWVHTASMWDEIAVLRAIQRHHQDTNGWPDIAYSFAVGQSGTVYECRGWGWDQFANGTDNVAPFTEHGDAEWHSVLALIGWDPETGIEQEPTGELLAALDELRFVSVATGACGLEVAPHRDWKNKPCPGTTLTGWAHHRNGRPLPPVPAPPAPTPPTGDPDMATLITITDDPAGAVLAYDGITLRWIRRADDPTIDLLPTKRAFTVEQVRTIIASGAVTEGPSPSIAGSAVGW